jgi:hypothetical protein
VKKSKKKVMLLPQHHFCGSFGVWRLPKNSRIQRQTMNDPRQTAFT